MDGVDKQLRRSFYTAFGFLIFATSVVAQNYRTDSKAPYVHRISIYDGNVERIDISDTFGAQPYSPRTTCGKCHNIDLIGKGWHFNSTSDSLDPGRKGEPWFWIEPSTRTLLPLSYRDWPGTFRPEQVGVSDWQFLLRFGRHLTGGGPGISAEETEDRPGRWRIAGDLEIDCMICHSADRSYDPGEWADQIEKENFKWAPSAAEGLASILGTTKDLSDDFDPEFPEFSDPFAEPPQTRYRQGKFEGNGMYFFDMLGKPPDQRCYYCHTNHIVDPPIPKFEQEVDIHLAAGLSCSDCHRHGLDHKIERGYEIEPGTSNSLTCMACHIADNSAENHEQPRTGQFGAPIALHKGIPPIHLETLTCTACHSGPRPRPQSFQVQTAMAHGLGLARDDREQNDPPIIYEPVYIRQSDGRIAPHRLVWPSFWARMDGEKITPIAVETVESRLGGLLDDSGGDTGEQFGLSPIEDARMIEALNSVQAELDSGETAIYITGGKAYRIIDDDINAFDHTSAQPYSWPLAHPVRARPASLGARGCNDCHALDSAFYFGEVKKITHYSAGDDSAAVMTGFMQLNTLYAKIFAISFLFRSLFKFIVLVAGILIVSLLVLYGFKGLARLTQFLSEKQTE